MSKQPTQPETLFDDDMIDEKIEHIVDTRGISYAQARSLVELDIFKPPELKVREPEDGVSVELGARALALHNIMATYNQLNRTRGARITSEYPDNEFDARYDYPERVIAGMGRKAAAMLHHNKEDLRILNATDELIAAGYDPRLAQLQERRIGNDLLDAYGPGKAHAGDREKVVKRASKTAQKVNKAIKLKTA
jgi:hypothetical protein